MNKETINEGDATGGRSLIIDPWVKADNYYRWHGIIRNIKIREPMQVNVKISIAQVTKKFDETIGVDWSTLGNQSGSFSFVKFHPQDLVTVVNALGNDNLAHVLAEPNLTVISGGTAHFLSGGEVPVVTSNLNGSTVTFKPYGVSLDIGAKVLTSDIINLEVAPAVSEIEKTIEQSGFSMPQFLTSQTSTTIQLHDGDSFIISGMTNSLENERESRIPLLGDIPLLGAIFSKDTTQDQKSELVIVATVNLVRPNKENDIVLPYIKTTSILTRLLNTDQVLVENEKRNDQSLKKLLDHGGYIK
ncbi:type II and III secretion system protein family protein [Vibrio mediterranei]